MEQITRSDLPAVVKRAAELAAVEGDAEETISEEEVVRIAAELGLAERHVRQALYEGVAEPEAPTYLDRHLGPPRIMATRAVPFTPEQARRALEDYLVTREYLQIVRRQSISTSFERADDAVSRVARKFSRSKKHCLASAEAVEVTLRELQPGWTHVRIRAVYPDERKARVISAGIGTALVGGWVGVFTTAVVDGLASGVVGDPAGLALGVTAGITMFGGIGAALFTAVKNNYHRWRARTITEANAILDRLEKGEEMRPPPAPWLRKLQLRFR